MFCSSSLSGKNSFDLKIVFLVRLNIMKNLWTSSLAASCWGVSSLITGHVALKLVWMCLPSCNWRVPCILATFRTEAFFTGATLSPWMLPRVRASAPTYAIVSSFFFFFTFIGLRLLTLILELSIIWKRLYCSWLISSCKSSFTDMKWTLCVVRYFIWSRCAAAGTSTRARSKSVWSRFTKRC